ncbi:MAG: signal recognition particle-docking protein FtsY [Candidatus Aenigmarchaeota archaeon]|nr:signal recognition particle-docking protein FtsY [Candidatus Aenigmarchaeota archaeon]
MFGALKKKLQEAISRITGKEKPAEEEKPKPQETTVEPKQPEVPSKLPSAQDLLEEKTEGREEKPGQPEEIKKEEAKPFVLEKEEKPLIKEVDEILEEEKLPVTEKEEKERLGRREELKPEPVLEEEKPGFFSGLLRKVTKKVTEKTLGGEEIDKFLKDLQLALLENDVSMETAERICEEVKQQLSGKSVRRGDVEKEIKSALRSAMLDVMQQPELDLEKMIEEKGGSPLLVVFFGFNGTGKTTSIAKLAHRLKQYRPVIAAGDTFRAASIEQLEEHGRRLGVDVVKHKYGADSAAVIFDAVKHASAVGGKIVLADTAGRSHSNVNLMDELKKIVRVNKPDLKVLILDSITGNDIYDQSVLFEKAAGVDAIILTKADVYEKGGAALSATHTLKKPVLFLGVGQEYGDLKEFEPEEIVRNLLE